MRTITITKNIYKFDELSDEAKGKAIDKHRDFLLSIMAKEDFITGDDEYDTEEEIQKAYETEYNYFLNYDEPIIESIEINEYDFFEDGSLF